MRKFELMNNVAGDAKGHILPVQIEDYLRKLNFYEDCPVYVHHPNVKGFSKWYPSISGLYSTHVTITHDNIYFYKEYDCGGYIASHVFLVPSEALIDLNSFIAHMNTVFEIIDFE